MLVQAKQLYSELYENTTDDEVLSPTYSIINEQGDFAHADFYHDDEEIVHLEMGLYAEEKIIFSSSGAALFKEIKSQLGDQFVLRA